MIESGGNFKEDEVYQGLLQNFKDDFMSLTKDEAKSLKIKEMEYKELLKKSVQLTYILLNMNPNNIKSALEVYMNYISNI